MSGNIGVMEGYGGPFLPNVSSDLLNRAADEANHIEAALSGLGSPFAADFGIIARLFRSRAENPNPDFTDVSLMITVDPDHKAKMLQALDVLAGFPDAPTNPVWQQYRATIQTWEGRKGDADDRPA